MRKVLFICTHNSARSQMAEGLMNALYGNRYNAYSAGISPAKVNQYAIEVMKEISIDISKQQSKDISEFRGKRFDYVVTVCSNAKTNCPFFPGAKKYLHKSFDDPSGFTEEEVLGEFRRIRDQIKAWIEETFVQDKKKKDLIKWKKK